MSVESLYVLSSITGIISGVSIITGTILTDLIKSRKGAFFNFFGALVGTFGITGVYLWQREEAGVFGVVAYAFFFIGLALIACTDYIGAFYAANLSEELMSKLGNESTMKTLFISFAIFLVGEIMFGISTILAGIFPIIPVVLFMVGFMATVARPVNQRITFAGLLLAGSGLIWLGISLWLNATSSG